MIMTSHKQPPQGAGYYCMMFGQFATQQAAGNRAQRDLKDGEDETTKQSKWGSTDEANLV